MNLTHTRIATYDLPRLVEFYSAVTQIKPVGSDNYVEFRSQAGTLAICSQRTVDLHNTGVTIPASNRSVIIEFQVGDVDLERTRLSGIVPEFVLEPTTQPWGNRSMLFRDPDGTRSTFSLRSRSRI